MVVDRVGESFRCRTFGEYEGGRGGNGGSRGGDFRGYRGHTYVDVPSSVSPLRLLSTNESSKTKTKSKLLRWNSRQLVVLFGRCSSSCICSLKVSEKWAAERYCSKCTP